MLKELSRPLNSSLSSTKYTSSNYKTPKKTYKTSLSKCTTSPLRKSYPTTFIFESPVKVYSSNTTVKTNNRCNIDNVFTSYANYLTNVQPHPNSESKTTKVSTSIDFCNTLSESDVKKKHKNFLIDNITTLSKKLSHCHSQINVYKECNKKTAKENLQIEFEQDSIIHDRIHMTGVIPRLRVRINDMREEIMKLDKETKYYEILKYQFLQEKVFMEEDLKRMDKKVKEFALETNALSYQVGSFRRRIKEIKIVLSQKKKENTFIKDVSRLIAV